MPTVVESLAQAVACYKSGDLSGAEQCCRRALQADPVNVEAQHLLGATFLGLGKLDDAVTALSQAVTIDRERGERTTTLASFLNGWDDWTRRS